MARPLRIEAAGMWYHIMNRGNLRKEIFMCDEDYINFLEILNEAADNYKVELHSYVLMPNHFHFFLKTTEANLSRFMHWLLTTYTNRYNHKYKRIGHLFQGRYKSIVIDSDSYGIEITRYIHLNPVRVKKNQKLTLKERKRILKNYRWSSYSCMIGIKSPPPFLYIHETLERFGNNYNEQIKNYIIYIEEGLQRELDNPFNEVIAQSVLGSKDFVRNIIKIFNIPTKYYIERKINSEKIKPISIEKVIKTVCLEFNIKSDLIFKNGRGMRHADIRRIAFYLAAKYCVGNITLKEIGIAMGCKSGSCITAAVKKFKKIKDKDLLNKVKKIEDYLKEKHGVRHPVS